MPISIMRSRTIRDSGDNLLRILNDILDLSKLEAGRIEFEQVNFSPSVLVDAVRSIVEPNARAKGLALKIDIDPRLPPALTGDAAADSPGAAQPRLQRRQVHRARQRRDRARPA